MSSPWVASRKKSWPPNAPESSKEIILSEENRKNIEEIQEIYLKGLTFHYVKDVKEVLDIALTQEKVAAPIDFTVKKSKEKEQDK